MMIAASAAVGADSGLQNGDNADEKEITSHMSSDKNQLFSYAGGSEEEDDGIGVQVEPVERLLIDNQNGGNNDDDDDDDDNSQQWTLRHTGSGNDTDSETAASLPGAAGCNSRRKQNKPIR